MAHIWKSLVADSKKTIDEFLDLIIEDLLVQCGSRLWRSREASCLALADLIQGRKFNQVISLYSFSFSRPYGLQPIICLTLGSTEALHGYTIELYGSDEQ